MKSLSRLTTLPRLNSPCLWDLWEANHCHSFFPFTGGEQSWKIKPRSSRFRLKTPNRLSKLYLSQICSFLFPCDSQRKPAANIENHLHPLLCANTRIGNGNPDTTRRLVFLPPSTLTETRSSWLKKPTRWICNQTRLPVMELRSNNLCNPTNRADNDVKY